MHPSHQEVALRELRPGTRLGRYTIIDRIGCGGMAELYLARAEGIGGFKKAVALKIVHAHIRQNARALRAFLREARLAATLTHPNIVGVIDVGMMGGEHVLVMEYVHGRDVAQLLGSLPPGTPPPLGVAVRIVLEACAGLQYAHEKTDADDRPQGIVHRDVSPSNVLVDFSGNTKLADFGIAHVAADSSTTKTGTIKGKFGYMSPEQSLGEKIDARSDIFAVGILLHEVTTNRRAFGASNPFAIMNKVLEGEYTPPEDYVEDYPSALSAIIQRALRVEREERYATVELLRKDLEAFAATLEEPCTVDAVGAFVRAQFPDSPLPDITSVQTLEPPAAPPETVVMAEPPPQSRGRGFAGGLGLGLVLALAVGWGVTRNDPVETTPTQPAPEASPPLVAAPVDPTPPEQPAQLETPPPDTKPSAPAAEEAESTDTKPKPQRRPRPNRKKSRHARKKQQPEARRDLDMFPASMR